MEVGIREFKNRATEWVRRAEAGEEITITRRHQPVAKLVPRRPVKDLTEGAARARMAELGILIPGAKPQRASRRRLVKIGGKPLSEMMIEDREDRL